MIRTQIEMHTFFATYGNCKESSLVSLLVSSIMARRSCSVPVLLPCTVSVLCGKISMPGTTFRRRLAGRLCFQHVIIIQMSSNANRMPPNAINATNKTIMRAKENVISGQHWQQRYSDRGLSAHLWDCIDTFYPRTSRSIRTALDCHRQCPGKRHDSDTDRSPSAQPNKLGPDTANSPTNRRSPRGTSTCTFHANWSSMHSPSSRDIWRSHIHRNLRIETMKL